MGGKADQPSPDEDVYAVHDVEPPPTPPIVEHRLRMVEQQREALAHQTPPKPRWPIITDGLLFPFRLRVLGPWMAIAGGSVLTGWLFMFWIQYGAVLGMTSARLLGLPVLALGTLTFSYAATCALTIIEATSYGRDSFDIVAGLEWKEWVWNLGHMIALVLQAAMVGLAIQTVSQADTYLPMAVATFVAFPLILLGALAANGAWVPMEIASVLRSLARVPHVWCIFFVVTGLLAWGWAELTAMGLLSANAWLTPLYSGPLLATMILIYARLVGRLAACITTATQNAHRKGDDRD